jgi:hypothetical protein
MRLFSRVSLTAALFVAALVYPTIASAHNLDRSGWRGHTTGYVYLDNNTTGVNTISAFSRSTD